MFNQPQTTKVAPVLETSGSVGSVSRTLPCNGRAPLLVSQTYPMKDGRSNSPREKMLLLLLPISRVYQKMV